jgi:NADH-quinone oxidoreductase subunit G
MAKVTIDDITIEVPDGTTILEAARRIDELHDTNIAPPTMCYYSKLKTTGGYCRTCIVEVAAGSASDPRPMPKPVASCRTAVVDGMIVKNTTSPELLEARAGVVEFLLINHPLDCPVCDQAGECNLQDLSYENGKAASRYQIPKRTFEPIDIGDKIKLNMNRCIMCWRCVKVCDQITDERVHGVINRGWDAEISTYIEKAIDNDFSGNVIDACPVGALTDRTFRFKSRVWFTKPLDAHRDCPKCTGKVRLWMKGDDVLRVTGRKNRWGEVEDFICNDCRFERKKTSDWTVEGPSKINHHSVIVQNHYELKQLQLGIKKQVQQLNGIKSALGEGPLNPNNIEQQ